MLVWAEGWRTTRNLGCEASSEFLGCRACLARIHTFKHGMLAGHFESKQQNTSWSTGRPCERVHACMQYSTRHCHLHCYQGQHRRHPNSLTLQPAGAGSLLLTHSVGNPVCQTRGWYMTACTSPDHTQCTATICQLRTVCALCISAKSCFVTGHAHGAGRTATLQLHHQQPGDHARPDTVNHAQQRTRRALLYRQLKRMSSECRSSGHLYCPLWQAGAPCITAPPQTGAVTRKRQPTRAQLSYKKV